MLVALICSDEAVPTFREPLTIDCKFVPLCAACAVTQKKDKQKKEKGSEMDDV